MVVKATRTQQYNTCILCILSCDSSENQWESQCNMNPHAVPSIPINNEWGSPGY